MSSYVRVESYGERITVVCEQCNLEQVEPFYKTANALCRTHNAQYHPTSVDWAA